MKIAGLGFELLVLVSYLVGSLAKNRIVNAPARFKDPKVMPST